MEWSHIYIKHETGLNRVWVMRFIADQLVDGRIMFTGIEQREDGVYWVKDCGEYEIVVEAPVDSREMLVLDVHGRSDLQFEVRSKEMLA